MVSRIVAPEHEGEYQRWMLRVLEAVAKFPNNLGAVVLTPDADQSNVHYLVHRFADEESLRAWEGSEIRQKLSSEADAFSTAQRQQATGLETWFSIPGEPTLPPPPKWKMAVATFVVAYILTAIIIPAVSRVIPSWPFLASKVVISVLLSVLITYVAMPLISRVLRRWLYPADTARRP